MVKKGFFMKVSNFFAKAKKRREERAERKIEDLGKSTERLERLATIRERKFKAEQRIAKTKTPLFVADYSKRRNTPATKRSNPFNLGAEDYFGLSPQEPIRQVKMKKIKQERYDPIGELKI